MARQEQTEMKIMLFTDDLHILLMLSYVLNSKPINTFKDSFKTISQTFGLSWSKRFSN